LPRLDNVARARRVSTLAQKKLRAPREGLVRRRVTNQTFNAPARLLNARPTQLRSPVM